MNSTKLTLKPITKKQAMAVFDSLVNQGLNPVKSRYCTGSFNWYGSAKYYHDKEFPVHSNVKAIWVERRNDSDGPYAVFMCITLPYSLIIQ